MACDDLFQNIASFIVKLPTPMSDGVPLGWKVNSRFTANAEMIRSPPSQSAQTFHFRLIKAKGSLFPFVMSRAINRCGNWILYIIRLCRAQKGRNGGLWNGLVKAQI